MGKKRSLGELADSLIAEEEKPSLASIADGLMDAPQTPPTDPFASAPSSAAFGGGGAASAGTPRPVATASPSMQGGGVPPSGSGRIRTSADKRAQSALDAAFSKPIPPPKGMGEAPAIQGPVSDSEYDRMSGMDPRAVQAVYGDFELPDDYGAKPAAGADLSTFKPGSVQATQEALRRKYEEAAPVREWAKSAAELKKWEDEYNELSEEANAHRANRNQMGLNLIEPRIGRAVDMAAKARDKAKASAASAMPLIDRIAKDFLQSPEMLAGKFMREQEDVSVVDTDRVRRYVNDRLADMGLMDSSGRYDTSADPDMSIKHMLTSRLTTEVENRDRSMAAESALKAKIGERRVAMAEDLTKSFVSADAEVQKINESATKYSAEAKAEVGALDNALSSQAASMKAQYEQDASALLAQGERINQAYQAGSISQQQQNQGISEINAKLKEAQEQYNGAVDGMVKSATERVGNINFRWNSKFKQEQEGRVAALERSMEEFEAAFKEKFGEDPKFKNELLRTYNDAWNAQARKEGTNEAKTKAAYDRYMKDAYGVRQMNRFAETFVQGLGGAYKTMGITIGSPDLYDAGVRMENKSILPDRAHGGVKDLLTVAWVESQGRLAGRMFPNIVATGLSAAATAPLGGVGAAGSLARIGATGARWGLTGAVGGGMETIDLAAQMRMDVLDKTGDIVKANKAADRVWDAQTAIWWSYLMEGAPFLKLPFAPKSRILGGVMGYGLEFGQELLFQEGPQQIAEKRIMAEAEGKLKLRDGLTAAYDNFYEGVKDMAKPDITGVSELEKLVVDLSGMGLIGVPGGVSSANQARRAKSDMLKSYAADAVVAKHAELGDAAWLNSVIERHGSDFALELADTFRAAGQLDVIQHLDLRRKIGVVDKARADASALRLTGDQSLAYTALSAKAYEQRRKAAESEDGVVKKVHEAMAAETERTLISLASGKDEKYFTVKYPDGRKVFVTEAEGKAMFADMEFVGTVAILGMGRKGGLEITAHGAGSDVALTGLWEEVVEIQSIMDRDIGAVNKRYGTVVDYTPEGIKVMAKGRPKDQYDAEALLHRLGYNVQGFIPQKSEAPLVEEDLIEELPAKEPEAATPPPIEEAVIEPPLPIRIEGTPLEGIVGGRAVFARGDERIEGDVYLDGRTVVIETPERVYEVGNVDDLSSMTAEDMPLSAVPETISVTEDGGFVYAGADPDIAKGVIVPQGAGLKAIKRGKDGGIKRIVVTDADGNTKNIRGQEAEDLAYRMMLRAVENNQSALTKDDSITEEIDAEHARQTEAASTAKADAPSEKGAGKRDGGGRRAATEKGQVAAAAVLPDSPVRLEGAPETTKPNKKEDERAITREPSGDVSIQPKVPVGGTQIAPAPAKAAPGIPVQEPGSGDGVATPYITKGGKPYGNFEVRYDASDGTFDVKMRGKIKDTWSKLPIKQAKKEKKRAENAAAAAMRAAEREYAEAFGVERKRGLNAIEKNKEREKRLHTKALKVTDEENGAIGIVLGALSGGKRVSRESVRDYLGWGEGRNEGANADYRKTEEEKSAEWALTTGGMSLSDLAHQLYENAPKDQNGDPLTGFDTADFEQAIAQVISGYKDRASAEAAYEAHLDATIEAVLTEEQRLEEYHKGLLAGMDETDASAEDVDTAIAQAEDEFFADKPTDEEADEIFGSRTKPVADGTKEGKLIPKGVGDREASRRDTEGDAGAKKRADPEEERLAEALKTARAERDAFVNDFNDRGQGLFAPDDIPTRQQTIDDTIDNSKENFDAKVEPLNERVRQAAKALADYVEKGADRAAAAAKQTAIPEAPEPSTKSQADAIDKAYRSASRFKPNKRVEFGSPITGPSGARLTAYEWKYKFEEYVDSRGEDRVKRVSDWDMAELSDETGRDIVHQFEVVDANGRGSLVSAESALKIMGYMGGVEGKDAKSMMSAAKTLAGYMMQLDGLRAELQIEKDAKAKVAKMRRPEVVVESGSDEAKGIAKQRKNETWSMGDAQVWVMYPEDGSLSNEERNERLKTLEYSWEQSELKKLGVNPYARTEQKIAEIERKVATKERQLGGKVMQAPAKAEAPAPKKEKASTPTSFKRPNPKPVKEPTVLRDVPSSVETKEYAIKGFEEYPVVVVKGEKGWNPVLRVGDFEIPLGKGGHPTDGLAAFDAGEIMGKAGKAKIDAAVERAVAAQGMKDGGVSEQRPVLTPNQLANREELMPMDQVRNVVLSFVSEDAYSEGGQMTVDNVIEGIKEARSKYAVTNVKAILNEALKGARETWADLQGESMSQSEAYAYVDAIRALKEMASMPDDADVRAIVRTLSPRTDRGQRVIDPSSQRTTDRAPKTGKPNTDKALKALQDFGVKVIAPKNKQEYQKAIEGYPDGVKSSWGLYDHATRTIYVNPDGPDLRNTLFHESAHPVLAALFQNNPTLRDKFFGEIGDEKMPGVTDVDGNPIDMTYRQYGDKYADKSIAMRMEEAIAQFAADVTDGKVKVSTKPDSLYQRFKDFIKDILAALGWDMRTIDLSKPDNIREFAAQFKKAMDKGIRITGLQPVEGTTLSLQDDADRLVDGWYSRLDQAVAAKGNTQSGADWMKWAEARAKEGMLSMEEVKWTGLAEFLAGKAKVTPKDVREFLKENRVRVGVEEIGSPKIIGRNMQGEPIEEYTPHGTATKFSQYQLPGGTNYREVLVTLPPKPVDISEFDANLIEQDDMGLGRWQVVRDGRFVGNEILSYTKENAIQTAVNRMGRENTEGFRSSHFDEPNILVHLRLNDRTDADGKKVLFIEEMQSDWGQQGKKKGFAKKDVEKKKPSPVSATLVHGPRVRGGLSTYSVAFDDGGTRTVLGETEVDAIRVVQVTGSVPHPTTISDAVPSAPFVTSTDAWVELGMKQAIRMAVEGGYDRIAWTNGEQQNERYDLSKQVDRIEWNRNTRTGERSVMIEAPSGNTHLSVDDGGIVTNGAGQFDGKRLDEVIGKDMADKIMSQETGDLSGDGLKIGGSGMKGFYDKILPATAKKVSKKLGGDGVVGETSMSTSDLANKWSVRLANGTLYEGALTYKSAADALANGPKEHPHLDFNGATIIKEPNTSPQQSIAITPAMRERVGLGVPLMQRPKTTKASEWNAAVDAAADLNNLLSKGEEQSILDAADLITDPDGKAEFIRLMNEQMGVTKPPLGTKANQKKVSKAFLRDELNKAVEAGKRAGIADVAKARKEFVAQVKDALSKDNLKGSLSDAQARSIATRATAVNPLNPKDVDRFIDYAEKVVAKANYAADLEAAESAKAKLRSAAKRPRIPVNIAEAMRDMSQVDVELLSDPLKYASMAEALLAAASPVKGGKYAMADIDAITDYLASIESEWLRSYGARLAEDFGISEMDGLNAQDIIDAIEGGELDAFAENLEQAKRAALKARMVRAADYTRMGLRDTDASWMQPDQKRLFDAMLNADLSMLTPQQVADYIFAADNIIINRSTDGTGAVQAALDGGSIAQNTGAVTSKHAIRTDWPTFGFKLGDRAISARDAWRDMMHAVPNAMARLAGFTRAMGDLTSAIGIADIIMAKTKVDKEVRQMADGLERFLLHQAAKAKRNGRNLDSADSRYMEGIVGLVMQGRKGRSEQRAFEMHKALIEQDIEKNSDSSPKEYAIIQRIYDKYVKSAASLGDVLKAFKKDFPENAAVLDYLIKMGARRTDEVLRFERSFRNHAEPRLDNWIPIRFVPRKATPADAKDAFGADFDGSRGFARLDKSLSRPMQSANLKQRAAEARLPEWGRIDYNARRNTMQAISRNLFDARVSPRWAAVRAMLMRPDAKEVLGGEQNVAYLTDTLADLYEAQTGLGLIDKKFGGEIMDAIASGIKGLSARIGLAGMMQIIQQPSDQLTNAYIMSSAGPGDFIRSMRDVLNAKDNGLGEFLSMGAIGERGELLAGTKWSSALDAEMSRLSKIVETGAGSTVASYLEGMNRKWFKPLAIGDVISASTAWVQFYKKHMAASETPMRTWHGEKEALDGGDEARKAAFAYAEMMTNLTQGPSDPAMFAKWARRSRSGFVNLFRVINNPYGSFPASMRARLEQAASEMRRYGGVADSDPSKASERERFDEAARIMAATSVSSAAFEATKMFITRPLIALMAYGVVKGVHGIVSTFGDDDDEDENLTETLLSMTAAVGHFLHLGAFIDRDMASVFAEADRQYRERRRMGLSYDEEAAARKKRGEAIKVALANYITSMTVSGTMSAIDDATIDNINRMWYWSELLDGAPSVVSPSGKVKKFDDWLKDTENTPLVRYGQGRQDNDWGAASVIRNKFERMFDAAAHAVTSKAAREEMTATRMSYESLKVLKEDSRALRGFVKSMKDAKTEGQRKAVASSFDEWLASRDKDPKKRQALGKAFMDSLKDAEKDPWLYIVKGISDSKYRAAAILSKMEGMSQEEQAVLGAQMRREGVLTPMVAAQMAKLQAEGVAEPAK